MEDIRVYDIEHQSIRRNITDEEIKTNIKKLLHKILGANLLGNSDFTVLYSVTEETLFHPITLCHEMNELLNQNNFKNNEQIDNGFDELANQLLESEMINDPENEGKKRRHKNIKSGTFIVYTIQNKMILLKLEDISGVDRRTFKEQEGLNIDDKYYKACVLEKNISEEIRVLDRNRSVAKYWAENFLQLERVRDNKVNTEQLINLIKKGKAFSETIRKDTELLTKIKNKFEELLFKEDEFSIESFEDKIKNDSSLGVSQLPLFCSQIRNYIDPSFDIVYEVVKEKFKEKFVLTEYVELAVHSLYARVNADKIQYDSDNNDVIINLDDKENISEKILKYSKRKSEK